ncbi:MAG TPA: folate-binding protein YgfZ [Byssovorax sp.]
MSDVADARAASEGGLLVAPRADLGALVVTGKDRVAWLNGLVTCELAKAKPGDGALGLAVGKTGKILAELWIVVAEDRLVVGVARAAVEALREHLEKHLIMEDVELADASDDTAWLACVGPRATSAVEAARASGGFAARLDWTGRADAAALALPALAAPKIEAGLLAAGAVVADDDTLAALSVAWGLPRFGVDFTTENLPHEASLEKLAVSFSKGCYLGQEAVFMLEARGHAKKHLARLAVDGASAAPRGAAVALADGTVVGDVTSSVTTAEGVVALAFVKHKSAEPGVALVVDGRPARLVDLAARPRA